MPNAIARAIGVRESPIRTPLEGVAESLTGAGALLYLDNLEHLAPAAVHVAELLHRTPDLDILATSRAPLRLSGEHVLPLEPLSVDDAATLFVELAAARESSSRAAPCLPCTRSAAGSTACRWR